MEAILRFLTLVDWTIFHPSEGYLNIVFNTSLASLTGLNNLSTIEGSLSIEANESLINFSGLDNLNSINGNLIINNNGIENIHGLQNLNSIGGNIRYSSQIFDIEQNLSHFLNLNDIGGNLLIGGNNLLSGLEGLDNIESSSIQNLYIYYNDNLTTCEVESICEYLTSPNGFVSIHDNSQGCNSIEEVELACESIGMDELRSEIITGLSPNPTKGFVKVQFSISKAQMVTLELFKISSVKVRTLLNEVKLPGNYEIEFDLSDLSSGIYFFTFETTQKTATIKMLKL